MMANLQATLSAASAGVGPQVLPHHPITCTDELCFDGENRLSCPHAKTETDDARMLSAIRHSIAVAIIEEAVRLYG